MTFRSPQTPEKNHLPLLLVLLAALAALVWYDRAAREDDGQLVAGREGRPAGEATAAGGGRQGTVVLSGDGAAPLINPLAGLTREALHDTVARPLFEPSRRAYTPPKPPAPPPPKPMVINRGPPPDPNAFVLQGIVAGEEGATALLLQRKGGRLWRQRAGDTIDGWQVLAVEARSVVLVKDGVEVTLRLFDKRPQPRP